MKPQEHHRRSIRLPAYDYAQEGYYFVTICSHHRKAYFGNIDRRGVMKLSSIGQIVKNDWLQIPTYFQNIRLDKYVIMPNHLHGIILIKGYFRRGLIHQTPDIPYGKIDGRDESRPYSILKNPMKIKRATLGQIIRHFKGRAAYDIHQNGFPSFQWQRNYYEHIIRNEESIEKIREYILQNPENWRNDRDNPINIHQFYAKI